MDAYWERFGKRRQEPTGGRRRKQKRPERLQLRDDNVPEIVGKGEQTTSVNGLNVFLEN